MDNARHRRGRANRVRLPSRQLALASAAVLTVGATAAGVVLGGWRSPAATSGCPLGDRALQVVAAPEIAPVIARMVSVVDAERGGRADDSASASCAAPVVRAEDPARTARALATDAVDRPDVWVPDSSVWTGGLADERAGVPSRNPSVASSPFVLAVPADGAGRSPAGSKPLRELLTVAVSAPVRWSLLDPRRSSSSVAGLLMAQEALEDRRDRAVVLAGLLRGAEVGRTVELGRVLDSQDAAPVVVPTTEQRAVAYDEARRSRPISLVYPSERTLAADYPYVVLAAERSRRLEAGAMLDQLHGDLGRRLLAASGFRDRFGVAGATLTARDGVDPHRRAPQVPEAAEVQAVVEGVRAIRRPSRLLTVLDVSGSMAGEVPEAPGLTRLDLAVRALVAGLATYQDDTVAGLWVFSTGLRPNSDHRVLVPPVPLATGPDGVSGRVRLTTALTRVAAEPYGGTGLYDTVLAAVRAARRGWDADRANSVIIVTDGANEDDHGIPLQELQKTLAAERDPSRPVTLYAVAYGPSADHAALRRIVRATGGATYQALDYRDLPAAIAEAIGRRDVGRR